MLQPISLIDKQLESRESVKAGEQKWDAKDLPHTFSNRETLVDTLN